MTHVDALSLAAQKETIALSTNVHRACTAAIKCLWEDASLTIERTTTLSDWVWRRLMLTVILAPEHIEQGDYTEWVQELISLRLGHLLLPTVIRPQDRRVHYTHWIERSVLEPLRTRQYEHHREDACVRPRVDFRP